MRILKILNGNDGGGVFTCEQNYIKYWTSKGVDVDAIIVGDGNSVAVYTKLLKNVFLLPQQATKYSGSIFQIIRSIGREKQFSRKQLDKLELTSNYDAIVYRRNNFIHFAGLLSKKLDIPVFWHLPSSINRFLGKVYYKYYFKIYGIFPIANSIYTKQTIGAMCKHVVYPGFSEERIEKKGNFSYREFLSIPKDAIVFGTASSLNYDKAQDLLVEGLIESGLLSKNVHCIIAGGPLDSKYSVELQKKIIPFKNQIHFVGQINDLSNFYNSIDIYVNSRRNAEPFGISIVEAMSANLPVIAFYKGGPSETVDDGNNGWLIKKATIEDYTKTFIKAYANRHKWKEMGISAKNGASKYSAAINAQKLLTIIQNSSNF